MEVSSKKKDLKDLSPLTSFHHLKPTKAPGRHRGLPRSVAGRGTSIFPFLGSQRWWKPDENLMKIHDENSWWKLMIWYHMISFDMNMMKFSPINDREPALIIIDIITIACFHIGQYHPWDRCDINAPALSASSQALSWASRSIESTGFCWWYIELIRWNYMELYGIIWNYLHL